MSLVFLLIATLLGCVVQVGAEPLSPIDPSGMLGCTRVHQSGYRGRGVTVAFIDTGFDGPARELLAWHDVVDGSEVPLDRAVELNGSRSDLGHGTMVAGCIRTTAPEAGLVGVRCDRNEHRVAEAIRWVTAHRDEYHIGVVNLSMAGENDPVLKAAVREAVGKGLVFVACMGNHGPRYDGGTCPANMPEVITVGAARDERTVSTFSSRGSTAEGLLKPDICAPGEFIPTWTHPGSHLFRLSREMDDFRALADEELVELVGENPAYLESWELGADVLDRPDAARLIREQIPGWSLLDDRWLVGRGTSLSAPLVSGVVATLLEANPGATPAQIKAALTETARPMAVRFGRVDRGAGFVDAWAALQRILALGSHQPGGDQANEDAPAFIPPAQVLVAVGAEGQGPGISGKPAGCLGRGADFNGAGSTGETQDVK